MPVAGARRAGLVVALLLAATVLLPAPARAAADPLLDQQWGLHAIGAPVAWATSRGEGITVAVIDTGADLDHEDLAGQLSEGTACLGTLGDAGRCGGSAEDDDGHGTHVAGVLAAAGANGKGGSGVAPAARLMVIRALRRTCVPVPGGASDCHGYGNTPDVSAALRWAVDHGAHVVNLSWAEEQAPISDRSVAEALAYAWSRGVIAVMASGNDAGATDGFPRDPVPAVVVTGTTRDGGRALYANGVDSRARWAVAAPGGDGSGVCPGGDVLSTYTPAGGQAGYGCLAGTSMASPHVAGVVALLRSLGLTPQETIDRLLSTARDAGAPGPDPEFGAGIVDAAAAVAGVPRRPGGPGGSVVPPDAGGAAAGSDGGGSSSASAPAAPAPAPGAAGEGSAMPAPAPAAPAPAPVRPPAAAAPGVPRPPAVVRPTGDAPGRAAWAVVAAAMSCAAAAAWGVAVRRRTRW